MPPARKFKKEDIINAAYEIVKEEGFVGVNARRVAKELGCSVQPIFHNFATMEELHKETYKKIYAKYQEHMKNGAKEEKKAYLKMGLSYIKFARNYPEFFKAIFMQKTKMDAESFVTADTEENDVIKVGQTMCKLSYEEQKKFHVKVWIFTHGIACLVATKTVVFSDEEIEVLLKESVREMLKGYVGGKEN